ncbi:MAG: Asp-tRNA(Asn)/Glu-tRNA(Gln) amidotransferase subunit GatA [Planctomycetota bacterium]
MPDLTELSACDLHRTLLDGETSAAEITRCFLDRIDRVDGRIDAFNTVMADAALAKAADIDERLGRDEPVGPLAGVPVAIKDNLCTRGVPTTCSSKILEDFVPPYDATVVERLDAADALPIGKTNMDEFAMGSSTENSGFKPTKNPWDRTRVPGGSSGGSAAAVAARQAALALGSDTGGSIRQPAGFCGVVGLKPTYGRVSRYGLVAFASSLDQIGTFSRDVRDAALLLSVIAGHDRRDSTSADQPVSDYAAELDRGADGMRIGVPAEYVTDGLDSDVKAAVEAAVDVYQGLGADIVDIALPHTDYAIAAYYIVATAEASSNLARYDGVHYGHRTPDECDIVDMYSRSRAEGFGAEVKRRIMLGTFALSSGYYDAYYLKALKARTLIKQDFDRAWEQVDCVLCPTSPTVAFKLGERTKDPLSMYLSDVYTISANLAGLPGVSINCGRGAHGLPVGLQLMAPPFEESRLLRAAAAFESATDHHLSRPPIASQKEQGD